MVPGVRFAARLPTTKHNNQNPGPLWSNISFAAQGIEHELIFKPVGFPHNSKGSLASAFVKQALLWGPHWEGCSFGPAKAKALIVNKINQMSICKVKVPM